MRPRSGESKELHGRHLEEQRSDYPLHRGVQKRAKFHVSKLIFRILLWAM